MKAVRLIFYVLSVIVFIVLFDLALNWLIANILVFDESSRNSTLITIIIFTVLAVLIYVFPKAVRGISKVIAAICPFKTFSFYFVLSALIVNGLYGIYHAWFNIGRSYSGVIIVANLVTTLIIIDFSYVLFKAHTTPD